MNRGSLMLCLCLALAVVAGATERAHSAVAAPPADGVAATYFHGRIRCESCKTIERFAQETFAADFAAEIAAGTLLFRQMDVTEAANKHFLDDYQLSSWSLVLVRYRGGKETGFKVLPKVWDYVGDRSAFRRYVKEETAAFLGGK